MGFWDIFLKKNTKTETSRMSRVCEGKKGDRKEHVKEEHKAFKGQEKGLCGCSVKSLGQGSKGEWVHFSL